MTNYDFQNKVNETYINVKTKQYRKTPFQIFAVFLLLLSIGISIHCLITYVFHRHQLQNHFLGTTSSPPIFEQPPAIEKPIWNESRLFNISSFQLMRNNASICNRSAEETDKNLLFIFVNSARENEIERSAIRKSVEMMQSKINKNPTNNWIVRLIFLIGEGLEPKNALESGAFLMEEEFLEQEESVFKDLVMGSFVDTFDNLTVKTMMGLKWALTYCQDAAFVVKMDDDIFFNIPKFIEFRNAEFRIMGSPSGIPDFYCIPEMDRVPQRKVSKELGFEKIMPRAEWPDEKYPDYCNGVFYGMTMPLIKKMYDVANGKEVNPFRLEDIFFTGIVLGKVNTRWGRVTMRNLDVGKESEQTIRTICEKKVMRQTVSQEVGLVVRLKRGKDMEKQMVCLAKEA